MSEIEYEVREKDLIAFNEHQMQGTESLQKVMRRHQAVIPGVVVIGALVLFFFYKDILTAAFVGAAAVAWGFAAPAYLKWIWRKQLRKLYSEEEKVAILGQCSLKIEKDALVEASQNGESRIAWSDILRVEVSKNYAFIFTSIDSALIVPRATVKKGNLHEFVKLADECIEKSS